LLFDLKTGKAGDEAGAGYGLFLMDLTKIGESE
jgi:hypothetical protein